MCCLQDHTHKHTVCSQKQSHAAIHPSATTAFTFCHHSRGMAPQHYGYFPVLSAFRWEIKSVKRVRETKKERARDRQRGVRGSWQREWQMLWTRRGENMWLVDHRPLTLTRPPWKKAELPWLLGEVTREEDGSQAYLWKIISFDTVVVAHTWLHALSKKIIFLLDASWTFFLWWHLWVILHCTYVIYLSFCTVEYFSI